MEQPSDPCGLTFGIELVSLPQGTFGVHGDDRVQLHRRLQREVVHGCVLPAAVVRQSVHDGRTWSAADAKARFTDACIVERFEPDPRRAGAPRERWESGILTEGATVGAGSVAGGA